MLSVTCLLICSEVKVHHLGDIAIGITYGRSGINMISIIQSNTLNFIYHDSRSLCRVFMVELDQLFAEAFPMLSDVR